MESLTEVRRSRAAWARRRAAVLIVAAAAVAAAGACATLARGVFQEPVVTFKELRLLGLGLTGGSMELVLNVYNPNDFRLDATRLNYHLRIDTVSFATGALDSRFAVQDNDSTAVTIPVAFTYAGIGEAGRQLINSGDVPYRVSGDITVATPVGQFTVPYDRAGRYTLLGGNRPGE